MLVFLLLLLIMSLKSKCFNQENPWTQQEASDSVQEETRHTGYNLPFYISGLWIRVETYRMRIRLLKQKRVNRFTLVNPGSGLDLQGKLDLDLYLSFKDLI